MAATMKDVAARAGVSPVVVSRVLHNKAVSVRVSDATAERVRQAASELGYRCNVFARNFRKQQTNMIGVLHGLSIKRLLFEGGSGYFAALMDGVVEGAFKHGYSIALCPELMGSTPENAVNDGRFDGLIWYSSTMTPRNRELLRKCPIPLVALHVHARDFEGRFPTVICDNAQGVGLAIDHLVSLGHRRIGFAIETFLMFGESAERQAGYFQHMGRHGLKASEEDVLNVGSVFSEVDAYLGSGPRHTAIVCHNDDLAAEFLQRAPQHGVEIPRDLSVVGFDSTSYCNELRPELTSVSQPLRLMGEKAVELLVRRMREEPIESPEVIIPCGFDVRSSTSSNPSQEIRS